MKYSIAAGLGALTLASALPQANPIPDRFRPPVNSFLLQRTIRERALVERANRLQSFADAEPGRNRVFGSAAHNATVQYIYDTLVATGNYDVTLQPFSALFSDGSATFVAGGEDREARVFSYSPSGSVDNVPIQAIANLGCNADDFPAGEEGYIALISRGECPFSQKVTNARAAGAAAAAVYNNVDGPLSGTLGGAGDYVPSAGIPQAQGQDIVAAIEGGAIVVGSLDAETITETRWTNNVIAQTRGGDRDNVLMVGSHTDSVVAGPGINDNGSGTIALLELATQLRYFRTPNAVRFGFWSAEEFGLLGAEHYVANLPAEELDRIRLYLNFDMIASPNFVYGIYDGDGSAFNVSGPAGSAEAEALFERFYRDNRIPSVPSEFTGRSDYGPFLDAGVAAGGLFTGAEVEKTEEEARLFGGQAGVSYDENYHLAGDTVDNLNLEAFMVNSRAIANSIATYARSWSGFPTRSQRVVKKRHAHNPNEIARCGEVIVEI